MEDAWRVGTWGGVMLLEQNRDLARAIAAQVGHSRNTTDDTGSAMATDLAAVAAIIVRAQAA
jgi:hypothetical protein